MLVMGCNIVEMLRLRDNMIQTNFEHDILAKIYLKQLALTNKQTWKLMGNDPILFDTSLITRDNLNLVDHNDGSKMNLELACVTEFDPSLKANMDFKSKSCIQALMTNLGLEELRAVCLYQLMQRQTLAIGVMRNQLLLDGPMQGLAELALLQRRPHSIAVPAPVIDLMTCLSKAVDGPHGEKCRKQAQKFTTNFSKEVGDRMYSIGQRKGKHRQTV